MHFVPHCHPANMLRTEFWASKQDKNTLNIQIVSVIEIWALAWKRLILMIICCVFALVKEVEF